LKKLLTGTLICLLCLPLFFPFLQILAIAGEAGLVARWKFDEGSGTLARDSSGNGNDGTITGARWVDGISRSALRFGEGASYMWAGFPADLSGNHEFTLSFWIKVISWPTSTQKYSYIALIGAYHWQSGDYDRSFHVLLDNDPNGGAPYGTVRANFLYRVIPTTHKFSTDTWYNWAFVYDKKDLKMYQNGTLLETIGLGGATPNLDSSGATLLSQTSASNQIFNGILDEVTIYNYARSPADILNDFKAVTGSSPSQQAGSDTIAYWKFDEGSGNIAHDSSGNGNDGTIMGAQWVDGTKGKGLSLDGINDYVSIPHSSSLDITGREITVEYWVKFPNGWHAGSSSESLILYDKGDAYTASMTGNNGRHRFNIPYVPPYPESNKNSWDANVWYHIADVFDGSQIRIYINGVLDKTESVVGSVSRSGIKLAIGSHCYGDSNYFKGVIDEFVIYNYARKENQIINDYTSAVTEPTPAPSADIAISTPRYTNNLYWDGITIDDWMRAATHTSLFCDVTISVEINPSSLVRNVQLRIDGLKPDVFTMTQEVGNKYSCHVMVSDLNNLKNLLLDLILSKAPGEVMGILPDLEFAQPKITSVLVTDVYGQVHERTFEIKLPTAQNLLPGLDFSSTAVVFQCPVDLLITDSQSRRTGAVYENGILKETPKEIPGAYYFGEIGEDKWKIVVLPYSEATYDITLFSFGSGSFEMNILSFKNGSLVSRVPSESWNVAKGDIVRCSLSASEGGGTLNLTAPVKISNGIPIEAVYALAIVVAVAVIAAAVVIRKRKLTSAKNTGQRRRLPPRDSYFQSCELRLSASTSFITRL
jgi:hypothetical protein